MQNWMIYGANGYTGRLIAQQAVKLGLTPILAGRGAAVTELANSLGLLAERFDLLDTVATRQALQKVDLVLNCAGPFSATAAPMIRACLDSGCHYLDITGEIGVFEHAQQQHAAAEKVGIVICPGVGFDVIPTDCVAAALKQALPDATRLALGFDSRSSLSPGTAKTSVEGLALGGKVRQNGQLTTVPYAWKVRQIDFGFGSKTAPTIPWGDVASAYFSTGIPNIEVYMATPPALVKQMRLLNWVKPALGWGWVQGLLKGQIEKSVRGPNETQRAKSRTAVWGEAVNAKGEKRTARIETANGYQLTIDGSLAIVQHILNQATLRGGYYTPSTLCGWQLVEQLPGSGKITLN